jgi:hypothetical protein
LDFCKKRETEHSQNLSPPTPQQDKKHVITAKDLALNSYFTSGNCHMLEWHFSNSKEKHNFSSVFLSIHSSHDQQYCRQGQRFLP